MVYIMLSKVLTFLGFNNCMCCRHSFTINESVLKMFFIILIKYWYYLVLFLQNYCQISDKLYQVSINTRVNRLLTELHIE